MGANLSPRPRVPSERSAQHVTDLARAASLNERYRAHNDALERSLGPSHRNATPVTVESEAMTIERLATEQRAQRNRNWNGGEDLAAQYRAHNEAHERHLGITPEQSAAERREREVLRLARLAGANPSESVVGDLLDACRTLAEPPRATP